MLKSQVKIGGHYVAMVSGVKTVVRLDDHREVQHYGPGRRAGDRYDVTNLRTGRRTSFRSAAKFQREATAAEVAAAKAPPPPKPAGPCPTRRAEGAEGGDGRRKGNPPADPPPVGSLANAIYTREPGTEDEQRPDPTSALNAGPIQAGTTSAQMLAPSPTTGGPDARDAAIRAWSAAGAPARAQVTKLVGAFGGPPAAPPPPSADGTMAGYRPTPEQEAILEVARRPGLRVLVVAAGAGTGKTSTLKMLEETLPGRGQYTAFNALLVAESKAKFKRARCNTTHSLAFGAVGRRYAHRLGGPRVRAAEVAAMLGIEPLELEMPAEAAGEKPRTKVLSPPLLASLVMGAVRRFCQSADREVGPEHVRRPAGVDHVVDGEPVRTNSDRVREYLVPFARAAWADLADPDGRLPFTHDAYVKVWQLGTGPDAPVIPADYILLDEAQDSAPVLLDVIRRQQALVVLVGDDNQRIYEWRGAVNAMTAFPGAPRRLLSQSFRFGRAVADVANAILAGLQEPTDLEMRGLEAIPSRAFLPGEPGAPAPDCVLCRTNAAAVGTVLAAVGEGKRPHLVGGGAEVVRFVKAARDLQAGRRTDHPDLCCFESWAEVQTAVAGEDGEDLKTMVKLIDEFGAAPILAALDGMPKEADADLVVCTAHKSKGREWGAVKLAADFPPANRMDDADRRLLYVATTRARFALDLTDCPPFRRGVDKQTGEPVEPIRVVWTAPRPTAEALAAYLAARPGGETTAAPAVPADPAAEPAPTPAADPTPARTPATGFSWGRYAGAWVVRGPAGAAGQTVTVARKDGTTSVETLGPVVRSYPEADLYRVGK